MNRRLGILAAALAVAVPGGAGAQTLLPSPLTSNPSDGEGNVPREQGRKRLLFQFRYFVDAVTESNAGFPLNMGMATVSLKIGAAPAMNCASGGVPAAGACSYRTVDGEDADGALDAVEVVYNGDFPALTPVGLTVSGARTSTSPVLTQNPASSTVTFTTGNNTPRAPVSLELVFDVSGSMGWPSIPAGTTPRMSVLKQAGQVLFLLLPDYAWLGDKAGLVYFSTQATAFDPTAGTATNLEQARDATAMAGLEADLQARTPTAATSIGAGLSTANTAGFAADAAAPAGTRKVVFLFSDGEQNTAPMVTVTAAGAGCPAASAVQVGGNQYLPGSRIHTITAGRMAAPGFCLQKQVAQATGGTYTQVPDVSETIPVPALQTFFTQALATELVGDKVEVVRDVTGLATRAGAPAETFTANPGDVALTVILSWQRAGDTLPGALPYRLRAPDGTAVDLAHRTRAGRNLSVATVHFPLRQGGAAVAHAGEWKVELLTGEMRSDSLDYHLMVLLDNRTLASAFEVASGDLGTGEPIPLRVTLSDAGAPVTGATVTARLARPGEGLGDVLSTTSTGQPPATPDPYRSPAQAKLAALVNDPAAAARLGSVAAPQVVLRDDGGAESGDAAAGDGVYSALVRETPEEGHYQFQVEVRGSTPGNGAFQRTQRLTAFVRPKPDATRTTLQVLSSAPAGRGVLVRIAVTPRDRFGNLLGPDYTGVMRVTPSQGTVAAPLEDRLDGSYVVDYLLPSSGSDPDISVEILGEHVVTRRLSDLSPGRGRGRWELGLHAGATLPHDSPGSGLDAGLALGLGLGYRFVPALAVEAYGGWDRFAAAGDGFSMGHLSGQLRVWPAPHAAFAPSLHAGAGAYFPEGGGTVSGANAGAGLHLWLNPRLAVEALYDFRDVDGGTYRYSTVKAGLRLRF